MNFVKTTAAACLLASAVFAETGFHMGARFAGGYSTIWNVDNKISSNDILQSLSIPAEELGIGTEVYVKDLDKLGGMGLSFGLSFLYQATESFGIQPELLFSYRARSTKPVFGAEMSGNTSNGSGSRNNSYYDDDDDYYDYYGGGSYRSSYGDDDDMFAELSGAFTGAEVEVDQWYLEIPVLFRLQPAGGLFLNLGPVLGINLSTDVSYSIASTEADDYVSSVVFGLIGGLGYSFDLGNGQKVELDFRFQMGLTSIISDEIEYSDSEESISIDGTKLVDPKDMILSLGISYWFL